MIFIVGDTHGKADFNKLTYFANQNPNLTKKDYVIIVGDAGIVKDKETLDELIKLYESLPFFVLFIDGNHENHEMLASYPIDFWNGGKVHKISENIIHLMRGQIFNIEEKTIFTFGGAESTDDKAYLIEGKNWWRTEVPSQEEFEEAVENLLKVDFKVDYIITHTIDANSYYVPPTMPKYLKRLGKTSTMLNYFQNNVEYKHWYCGHFHEDIKITYKKSVVAYEYIKLD